jgi:hypothetical protein
VDEWRELDFTDSARTRWTSSGVRTSLLLSLSPSARFVFVVVVVSSQRQSVGEVGQGLSDDPDKGVIPTPLAATVPRSRSRVEEPVPIIPLSFESTLSILLRPLLGPARGLGSLEDDPALTGLALKASVWGGWTALRVAGEEVAEGARSSAGGGGKS